MPDAARKMEPLVETSWLQNHIEDDDLRILDCHVIFERPEGQLRIETGRSLWEQGHIPRSSHVDLISDLSDPSSEFGFMMPSAEKICNTLSHAGVSEGTRVVLYDADQNKWAARVWWMLREVGFEDAAVLNGGWRKWLSEGRDVSLEPAPRFPASQLAPRRPATSVFVGKEDVLAAIGDENTSLVNALGKEEHLGQSCNYRRRGHIPTAVNVPAGDLVDPTSHAYSDLEILQGRFAPAIEAGAERVIVYCGKGISAASDAFILRLLGHNVSIYDASMSEWGADDSLPLTLQAH